MNAKKRYKKLIYTILGTILCLCAIYSSGYFLQRTIYSDADCPFCQQSVLNAQTFYEDDLVAAIYTHRPVMPGHCLIVPKRHVKSFEMLTDEEAAQINRVIRKVNLAASKTFSTSSYLLLEKNGRECGQSVPHVHFHYIPRQANDDSHLKFYYRLFIVNMMAPISSIEMNEAVSNMKMAMKDTTL